MVMILVAGGDIGGGLRIALEKWKIVIACYNKPKRIVNKEIESQGHILLFSSLDEIRLKFHLIL